MPKTPQELEEFYDRKRVNQPTAMVHIDRTRLSSMARSLIPLIIYVVQSSTKDKEGFYYLKKSFVRSATGQSKTNEDYTKINRAFSEIRDKKIEWNVLREDNTVDEYDFNFITARKRNAGRGIIGFRVEEQLEKHILNPKLYAKTKLVFMLLLARKKGGFDFYSLLDEKLSRTQSDEGEVVLSIEDFKRAQGVEESSYSVFKELKKWLINPLCDEITQNTDISVSFKGERYSGRRFTHIRFFITRQAWQIPLFDVERFFTLAQEMEKAGPGNLRLVEGKEVTVRTESEKEIINKFVKQGVTKSDVETALEKWGEGSIREIFDYCLLQYEKGKVKSLAGYMASCLKRGHGRKSKIEKESEEKKAKAAAKKKAEKEQREKQERIDKAKEEFTRSEVKNYISGLSDSESDSLLEELKAQAPAMIRRTIKNLNHPSLILPISRKIPDFETRLAQHLKNVE